MKHKSSAEIAQILERHQQSGLSLQKFAAQEAIAFSTVQRWARKARLVAADGNRARLVEVPNVFATVGAGTLYRVRFARGWVLELARGFEPGEVRTLAQLLQSL